MKNIIIKDFIEQFNKARKSSKNEWIVLDINGIKVKSYNTYIQILEFKTDNEQGFIRTGNPMDQKIKDMNAWLHDTLENNLKL